MLPTKTYQMTLGELTLYVIGDESGWSMLAFEGRNKIRDVPLGTNEEEAKAKALEFAATRVQGKYPEVEKTWKEVEAVPEPD